MRLLAVAMAAWSLGRLVLWTHTMSQDRFGILDVLAAILQLVRGNRIFCALRHFI